MESVSQRKGDSLSLEPPLEDQRFTAPCDGMVELNRLIPPNRCLRELRTPDDRPPD